MNLTCASVFVAFYLLGKFDVADDEVQLSGAKRTAKHPDGDVDAARPIEQAVRQFNRHSKDNRHQLLRMAGWENIVAGSRHHTARAGWALALALT